MQGADAEAVVSGMIGLLADVRTDLAQMTGLEPGLSARLLDQHARLLRFVQVYALGQEDCGAPGP